MKIKVKRGSLPATSATTISSGEMVLDRTNNELYVCGTSEGQDVTVNVAAGDNWSTNSNMVKMQKHISDLATIRANAALGATAIQEPDTEGTAGQVLSTNGNGGRSWVPGLPSQTGQGGKLLSTDGTNSGWTVGLTNVLSAQSTAQQIPTAKAIWDIVKNCVFIDDTATVQVQNDAPSTVYAPAVVTDSTSTSVTGFEIKKNAVYIFTQPLTSFNVNSIEDSAFESTVYFTTGNTFSYSFPQGTKTISSSAYMTTNKSYCISIKNLVMVLDEIESYIAGSTVIFSSEQLATGVIENPKIYESTDANPVIANTEPNAIYKFGTISSLTMQNVPANSLETEVYFTAGSTAVNVVLTGTSALKVNSGSTFNFVGGEFCISIKDGVVTANQIITL